MRRPERPQTRQHSHTPGRVSGRRGNQTSLELAGAFNGPAGAGPLLDDAGQVIEKEP
jgi:hypothetical protein